ncbi:MAG: HAD family phosphatase [Bacteroidales bacterium]|nr:HAD family phosphatase [Bacteroidales bacterium]
MYDFALIFDLDGVIADTGNFHEKAWFAYCQKYNIPITSELFRNTLFGRSSKETFSILLGRELKNNELAAMVAEKETLFRKLAKGQLSPTPGIIQFLETIKHAGIRACVASSAPKINVEFTLRQTGTSAYFDQITSAEEVSQSKPDPEIFILAAKKMGFAPEKCLVFEDSFAGIEAAKRAGMKLMLLATTHSKEELPADFPCIDDFINLHFDTIKKLF